MAILVQKLWGEKKLSKSVFGYFKTKKKFKKKVPMALSSRGGGCKALVVRPLKKNLFYVCLTLPDHINLVYTNIFKLRIEAVTGGLTVLSEFCFYKVHNYQYNRMLRLLNSFKQTIWKNVKNRFLREDTHRVGPLRV